MKSILFLMALLSLGTARADGFNCQSVDGDIRIQIINRSSNGDQPGRAALMVISDPSARRGRKTIATFAAKYGFLTNTDGVYIGYVDPANPGTRRSGERIGGTRLGQLRSVILDIDFSYREPEARGGKMAAEVTYLKRDGETVMQEFECLHRHKPPLPEGVVD